MFKSIDDVKEANRKAGRFWFSPDTMRFFDSRIESGIIAGRFFITSERFDDRSPRRYTVRVANDDGSIDTIGVFQQYTSKVQARYALDNHIANTKGVNYAS